MIRGQRGFSLPEAAVAIVLIGLISIAGLSVSKMTSDVETMQKSNTLNAALISRLSQTLNYPVSCGIAFQTAAVSSGGGITVTNDMMVGQDGVEVTLTLPSNSGFGDSAINLGAEAVLPNYGMRVRSLRIQNAYMFSDDLDGDGIADNNAAKYIADVVIGLVRTQDTWGGRGFRSQRVATIVLETDAGAGGKITGCHGVSAARELAEVCVSMQCNYDSGSDTCNCEHDQPLCDPGNILVSIADGEPNCIPINVTCPAGQGVINLLGTNKCAPFPTPTVTVPPSSGNGCYCQYGLSDGACTEPDGIRYSAWWQQPVIGLPCGGGQTPNVGDIFNPTWPGNTGVGSYCTCGAWQAPPAPTPSGALSCDMSCPATTFEQTVNMRGQYYGCCVVYAQAVNTSAGTTAGDEAMAECLNTFSMCGAPTSTPTPTPTPTTMASCGPFHGGSFGFPDSYVSALDVLVGTGPFPSSIPTGSALRAALCTNASDIFVTAYDGYHDGSFVNWTCDGIPCGAGINSGAPGLQCNAPDTLQGPTYPDINCAPGVCAGGASNFIGCVGSPGSYQACCKPITSACGPLNGDYVSNGAPMFMAVANTLLNGSPSASDFSWFCNSGSYTFLGCSTVSGTQRMLTYTCDGEETICSLTTDEVADEFPTCL